jgi:hypothetical protein
VCLCFFAFQLLLLVVVFSFQHAAVLRVFFSAQLVAMWPFLCNPSLYCFFFPPLNTSFVLVEWLVKLSQLKTKKKQLLN